MLLTSSAFVSGFCPCWSLHYSRIDIANAIGTPIVPLRFVRVIKVSDLVLSIS